MTASPALIVVGCKADELKTYFVNSMVLRQRDPRAAQLHANNACLMSTRVPGDPGKEV